MAAIPNLDLTSSSLPKPAHDAHLTFHRDGPRPTWGIVYSPSSTRIPAQGNGRRMQALRQELHAAWDAVINEAAVTGTYTLGSTVRQFEQLIEVCWRPADGELHAVMVNSGTTALHGALIACGIKPGDYVAVPAMSFLSTALVCQWVGAIPLFVDIRPTTWTLDVDVLKHLIAHDEQLRARIKAVIPVYMYGGMMPRDDLASLLDLAAHEGWKVIEDASQAHGASVALPGDEVSRYAGTLGDAGCFSLSGVKNAGVPEDGGCILTRSAALAEFLRMWRDLGRKQEDRSQFHLPGVRGRMGKLAAAGGIVQFRHLDHWNARRRQIAHRYTAAIREAGLPLMTPVEPEGSVHVYYKYVVVARTPAERERIEDCLDEAGVETEHYYPCILPDQPVYQSGVLEHGVIGDLSVSRHLAVCGTCLPIYPELLPAEQERVITALKQAYSGHGQRASRSLGETPEPAAQPPEVVGNVKIG